MKKKQIMPLILLFGYTLGLWKGNIALWRGSDPEPIRIFPYSAASLPPADQKALAEGIPIENRRELLHLLEDYLS